MCVFMYVRVRVCEYVCVCAYAFVWRVCVRVCVNVCVYVYAPMCVCDVCCLACKYLLCFCLYALYGDDCDTS